MLQLDTIVGRIWNAANDEKHGFGASLLSNT